MVTREENIRIFKDTQAMIRESEELRNAVKHTRRFQRFYPDDGVVYEDHYMGGSISEKRRIIVSKKRTFEAAAYYRGKKTCVLNFASAINPGGGVVHGASAQEESLCRCSTLYNTLAVPEMMIDFYESHRMAQNPLNNADLIYSPDVMVIKTDTEKPERLKEADWYPVNVITCAAPCFKRSDDYVKYFHDHYAYTYMLCDRIERIFSIAAKKGNEILILGAFGCGAYNNYPILVADAFYRVAYHYQDKFATIEFAIYCQGNDQNYRAFDEIFRS